MTHSHAFWITFWGILLTTNCGFSTELYGIRTDTTNTGSLVRLAINNEWRSAYPNIDTYARLSGQSDGSILFTPTPDGKFPSLVQLVTNLNNKATYKFMGIISGSTQIVSADGTPVGTVEAGQEYTPLMTTTQGGGGSGSGGSNAPMSCPADCGVGACDSSSNGKCICPEHATQTSDTQPCTCESGYEPSAGGTACVQALPSGTTKLTTDYLTTNYNISFSSSSEYCESGEIYAYKTTDNLCLVFRGTSFYGIADCTNNLCTDISGALTE